MIFFKNADLYTVKHTKSKNKIGQVIDSYVIDKSYRVNKQPIDEKLYKFTWGEDIKSNIQVYADIDLQIDDVVVVNNKTYKIEKAIRWNTYNIYALLETDVKVIINE